MKNDLDCESLIMFKTLVDQGYPPKEAERLSLNVQEQRLANPANKIKSLVHQHALKIIVGLLTAKGSGVALWLGDII